MGIAMKKTIIIFLLLSIYSLAQENRLIRQNDLTDSLNAIRTLIGTGGIAFPDSVLFSSDSTAQRTFSDAKYQSKIVVNVKDFGAVGDSVTDDTDAFQDAINAGDNIFVPKGVYTVDSLVLDGNTEFIGVGNGSKICLKAGGTVLLSLVGGVGAYPYEVSLSDIKINNLWLSGLDITETEGGTPVLGDRVGINVDNAKDIYIDNCKITGFNLAGVITQKTEATPTYSFNIHVSNCKIESNYYGIWVKEESEYGFYENNLIQGYHTGVKLIGVSWS